MASRARSARSVPQSVRRLINVASGDVRRSADRRLPHSFPALRRIARPRAARSADLLGGLCGDDALPDRGHGHRGAVRVVGKPGGRDAALSQRMSHRRSDCSAVQRTPVRPECGTHARNAGAIATRHASLGDPRRGRSGGARVARHSGGPWRPRGDLVCRPRRRATRRGLRAGARSRSAVRCKIQEEGRLPRRSLGG